MKVLVDGQIKKLVINDIETEIEWTEDIIGNADGFDDYDDELGLHVMNEDAYEWWKEYLCTEQDIERRIAALKNELEGEDLEQFNEDIINIDNSGDLIEVQSNQIKVIEEHETNKKEEQ